MSHFISIIIIATIIVTVAGLIFTLLYLVLFLVLRRFRTRIGYGWVLEFNENNPAVVVKSRLIESPAGEAGVQNGSVVLEHNGIKLDFKSNDDFAKWVEEKKPIKEGDSLVCRITDGKGERCVTMEARRIRHHIPVYYWGSEGLYMVNGYWVQYGMGFCPLTGHIYQTRWLAGL